MRKFLKNLLFRIRWIIAWFKIWTNADERKRRVWAKASLASLRSKYREDQRRRLSKELIIASAEPDSNRPYRGCMTREHFDVIKRNRVVVRRVEGTTVFEINTKNLAVWELEEFRAMLKEDMVFRFPPPIIREILSDRFPQ